MLSRNLPPLRGGMERLNRHIAEELARGFELAVCGPEGSRAELPFARLVREAPLRPLSRFLTRNFRDAIDLARTLRPQLIFCGSGLTVPTALIAARFCNARVIAYLHGLDIVADHPVYRLIWRRSLRRADAVIVNSRNTAAIAAAAGIARQRLHVLNPGVSLPRLDAGAAAEFRRQFDLGDRPLLLSLGRLTERKGLAEFIERAMPDILRAHPQTLLVVIGEEARDALVAKAAGQRERIEEAARRAGASSAVRLLGTQPDAVVSGAFQAAAALVFPVLAMPGDVEGFGMVAVEAAAHGTPTVAFAVGGVPDAIDDPASGRLLQPGDYQGFGAALNHYLDGSASGGDDRKLAEREARQAYAAGFAWPVFGERLRAICADVLAAT